MRHARQADVAEGVAEGFELADAGILLCQAKPGPADYWANSIGRRNTFRWRWANGTATRMGGCSGGTADDALAGSASGGETRRPGAVLGGDRQGTVQSGRRHRRRSVSGSRHAVVPRQLVVCRRSARGGVGAVFVVCRAGGDRDLARRRCAVREIARRPAGRRRPSRGSCARNAATGAAGLSTEPTTAQWHADRRARRPKIARLAANERLAGVCARPALRRDHQAGWRGGPSPDVRWIGRRHGRRADRRWARSWSPEQIANQVRPAADFPDDEVHAGLARGDLPGPGTSRAAARCGAS